MTTKNLVDTDSVQTLSNKIIAPENLQTTFTPALLFGGAAVGMTYSARGGAWNQVGNRVFGQVHFLLTAKGSSTGTATITMPGLPNATSQYWSIGNSGRCGYAITFTGLTGPVYSIVGGGPVCNIYQSNSTGIATVTDANFTNTTELGIEFDYYVP